MMPDDPRNGQRFEAASEGAELLREGDHEAARVELERVLGEDPANEYALFFLGALHFEQGRFDKALAAYVEASRIAPRYTGALAGAGHSLRMLGKHNESLRVAKQLLVRDREDPDGLHLAGLAHFARGESAAAKECFERYLRTGPEVEVAHEIRGLLEVLEGRVEAAED